MGYKSVLDAYVLSTWVLPDYEDTVLQSEIERTTQVAEIEASKAPCGPISMVWSVFGSLGLADHTDIEAYQRTISDLSQPPKQ